MVENIKDTHQRIKASKARRAINVEDQRERLSSNASIQQIEQQISLEMKKERAVQELTYKVQRHLL